MKDETKETREKNIFLQDKIEKYKKSNEEYIELNKELYYRIDKAIEYIKIPIVYETNNIEDLEKTNRSRNAQLINILQGSDE